MVAHVPDAAGGASARRLASSAASSAISRSSRRITSFEQASTSDIAASASWRRPALNAPTARIPAACTCAWGASRSRQAAESGPPWHLPRRQQRWSLSSLWSTRVRPKNRSASRLFQNTPSALARRAILAGTSSSATLASSRAEAGTSAVIAVSLVRVMSILASARRLVSAASRAGLPVASACEVTAPAMPCRRSSRPSTPSSTARFFCATSAVPSASPTLRAMAGTSESKLETVPRIAFVAVLVCSDSARTSSATTEIPCPASPARRPRGCHSTPAGWSAWRSGRFA